MSSGETEKGTKSTEKFPSDVEAPSISIDRRERTKRLARRGSSIADEFRELTCIDPRPMRKREISPTHVLDDDGSLAADDRAQVRSVPRLIPSAGCRPAYMPVAHDFPLFIPIISLSFVCDEATRDRAFSNFPSSLRFPIRTKRSHSRSRSRMNPKMCGFISRAL